MKNTNLLTVAAVFLASSQGAALAQNQNNAQHDTIAQQAAIAQAGSLAGNAFVNVSFGAVIMQVPVSLAIQLCPGTDANEMAAQFGDTSDVACTIPHEAYTSHSVGADPATQ
jgi:hypothetical protein